MRKMKDSGVGWIGDIPVDWQLSKIGEVYQERNTKVSDKDYMALSVTKQGIVPQLDSAAKSDNSDNRKLIKKKDFVINSRSDRRGSCGISDYDGSCSLINIVITPRRNMHNEYYSFLFRSELFADEFYRWGNGIVDDLWSTKWSNMKRIYIPFPPLPTQRRIADYLDDKCARIDSIIEREQVVIEKLKDYKLSVITEAVTKGLNPDVPMKDSGVEWIGEIPENWDIAKLDKFSLLIQTGPFGSQLHADDYVNNGIPIINPTNIKDGRIIPDLDCSINYEMVQSLNRHILKYDDIVFARRGEMGRCARVDKESAGAFCGTGCLRISLGNKILSSYVSLYLQTTYIKQYLKLVSVGTTMSNLNGSILSSIPTICPPHNVQQQIVDYLDSKCSKIDFAIDKKQTLINQLTEYKKSLIYEVVTGKKEV